MFNIIAGLSIVAHLTLIGLLLILLLSDEIKGHDIHHSAISYEWNFQFHFRPLFHPYIDRMDSR